jgi:hypothetical protein
MENSLECGGLSPLLWAWESWIANKKRRQAAALQIGDSFEIVGYISQRVFSCQRFYF